MPPGVRKAPIDTVTDIDTPERIRFSCRLAGPSQRAAAYCIDGAVCGLVLTVCVVVGVMLDEVSSDVSGFGSGFVLLVLFAIEWLYYVLSELLSNGQSIGKRTLRLRVVCSSGLPIGARESVLRNLLRAADYLPGIYVIGALVMSIDPKFRRLGDLVAGTMVVSELSEAVLPPIVLHPPPSEQEVSWLPRVVLSAPELEALDLFMRRRQTLSPARATELAELVAPMLARRMQVVYTDPVRFVGLLYHRATTRTGAAA